MFRKKPNVVEFNLNRHYKFMYENFAILTQHAAYLLLEKEDESIHALRFDSSNCRYGGPNDEAHGGHPLAKYGLGAYGFYEVHNSPWIQEMMVANRVHPSHSDSFFSKDKHYIACFKDLKFECVCRNIEEVTLSPSKLNDILIEQLDELEEG